MCHLSQFMWKQKFFVFARMPLEAVKTFFTLAMISFILHNQELGDQVTEPQHKDTNGTIRSRKHQQILPCSTGIMTR